MAADPSANSSPAPRRLRLMLGGAGAIVAAACLAWFVVILGQPEEAPAVSRPVATAGPTAPVEMASTVPTPQPPQRVETPPPPVMPVVETQPPAASVQVPAAPLPSAPQIAAAPPSEPPPQAAPPPTAPALSRREIREVQKRLLGFGFSSGPIDGVAGPQTEVATQHYLEARGQPQMPPTDRQLLEQLRHDPAAQAVQPRVAQQATRPGAQGSAPPPRRQFDPFKPIKVAGAQITHWFQSAFR